MLSRRLGALAGLALALSAATSRADVGPPDYTCEEALRCPGEGIECSYYNPEGGVDPHCDADAAARGFEAVCGRGGGTAGVYLYCPKGTNYRAATLAGGGAAAGALVAGLLVRRRRLAKRKERGRA